MMTEPSPPISANQRSDPNPTDAEPIENVTSDDRTPYAIAREERTGGFWKMCKLVWMSGKNRLTHLCLARPSAHSRRFARINILLFAAALMCCVFANASWHTVRRGPGTEGESATPSGKGWWQVVEFSFADAERPPDRTLVSSMWMNVPWASLAAGICFVSALILGMLLIGIMASLAQRSLQGDHRTEPRLRGGIHYSTAWLQLLTWAALILCIRPLTVLKEVTGWSMVPPTLFVDATALLLALLGLMLWWFWLIRLGGTVPESSRQPVTRFFVLWGPLGLAAALGAVVYGLTVLANDLPHRMDLNW